MTSSLTQARGSVIAGRATTVEQRSASAQCQIGKAPAQTTAQLQIAAKSSPTNLAKIRTPERAIGDEALNSLNESVVLRRSTLPLTSRQRLVLDFIAAHIELHGFPPTLREIGEEMSIRSTNGVNDHLRALERKGYIEREPTLSRSIRVIGMKQPAPPAPGAPPPVRTLIQVDREVLALAIAKLEDLENCIPPFVAERFEAVVSDLRTEMLRRST